MIQIKPSIAILLSVSVIPYSLPELTRAGTLSVPPITPDASAQNRYPSSDPTDPSDRLGGGGSYARGRVPGRRRGGGTRGGCPTAKSIPLTALVPYTALASQAVELETAPLEGQVEPAGYVGGTTVSEEPTLWFYIPYELGVGLTAEFTVQDSEENEIYELPAADFSLSEHTPGIVGITLPAEVLSEDGEVYRWQFKVKCEDELLSYVEGGIERVSLNAELSRQIAAAASQDQVDLYLEYGIWFDAITILGKLRQQNPNDAAIATKWTMLLEEIGINDIPADATLFVL